MHGISLGAAGPENYGGVLLKGICSVKDVARSSFKPAHLCVRILAVSRQDAEPCRFWLVDPRALALLPCFEAE